MKNYIKKFESFHQKIKEGEEVLYEANRKDISEIIKKFSNYFTISFEIEIENISFKNSRIVEKFKEDFKDFYEKWKDRIKFEKDISLRNGIEINFKKNLHLENVEEAIDFINDFFIDKDKQDKWVFSNRTGIHVNIGIKPQYKPKFNKIKGLLFVTDHISDERFLFKDMEYRKSSAFTQSIFSAIKYKMEYEDILKKTDLKSVYDIENYLNKLINELILKDKEEYGKNKYEEYNNSLGFNLMKLARQKYIEFRYIGGDINKDIVIDKLKFYCYVVYAMIDTEYKRKEYTKKLYKFYKDLIDIQNFYNQKNPYK